MEIKPAEAVVGLCGGSQGGFWDAPSRCAAPITAELPSAALPSSEVQI